MMENWLPVCDWNLYEVSDFGNVRRLGAHNLKPYLAFNGYFRVHLSQPGFLSKTICIHRLVCLAFHGPSPEGFPHVLHGPGGKHDNSASNLRWGNYRLNYADRKKLGEIDLTAWQFKGGEGHNLSRLSEAQILQIRFLSGKISQRKIAEQFSISQGHVNAIINRKRWKDTI
jgi:hypothetical protein